MRAVVYHGIHDFRVDNVPDPIIKDQTDVIIKITSTAICGSDLHLYNGYIPTMQEGDILGHEFMGEVVEIGSAVTKLKKGDRIVVPFTISCGTCHYCKKELYSLCDTSNPNKKMMEEAYGYGTAGIYGYSHMYGGFAGGQAEYARVPFADVDSLIIPESLPDEKVLFLTDIFPTGYMAAENCNIKPGDTIAVWGCGPVGQFTIRSCFLLGADRVIAIDRIPERLAMAKSIGNVDVINYEEVESVPDTIKELTHGKGPEAVIDAVGLEAHGSGFAGAYDKAKQLLKMETDRPTALREIIQSCGKGGYVSIPGVYGGVVDKFPIGVAFAKGLTMKMGQTHVQKYMNKLLGKIEAGEIDPSFVITHRMNLNDAPHGYEIFRDKEDKCIKIVMNP